MYFNSDNIMEKYKIRKNNEHHTIVAGELKSGDRVLYLNRNNSSKYNEMREKHPYIEFAESVVIHPIMYSETPKDILVVGAGGFTFGHEDKNNTYTYVDIDEDLLPVAEEYILKEPIGENKTFIPKPARGYLSSTDQKFDVIYLDAYLGGISIPEHLITIEFFEQVKSHLKEDGILMTNFILSPHFNNEFTRTMDNTMRTVFPHVTRTVIGDHYNLWSESENLMANVAYIYRHEKNYNEGHIYTDNVNTVFYDKPKKLSP